MSDTAQGPSWWQASDGKWYTPGLHPDVPLAPPAVESIVPTAADSSEKKPKKVVFQKAIYLGGLPGDKGGYSGNLIITHECIGMGALNPKKSPVRWDEMAGISFDSATAKKSRAGKVALFGPLALLARKTQSAADITVHRKDGNVALYTVPGKTGLQVRGKVQPFLMEHGVPCLDDAPTMPEAQAPGLSAADEIAKLAELHRAGALTDGEFAAQKAKLL